MLYVISTMSSSVVYCKYDNSREDVNVLLESVEIKGKTGVQDKRTLFCSNGGTITPITEEQYAWLKDNPLFQLHEKNGFLRVEKSKMTAENKAEKDAEVKDKSSQLKAEDFKKMKIKKPALTQEELLTRTEADMQE